MSDNARLDVLLVRRGLARSRREAHDLVDAGRVRVAGRAVGKAARSVAADGAIEVVGQDTAYVSRAGNKLAGALAAFGAAGLSVAGRRALDAGASTGGFTDVLLRAGVSEVVAVDVGRDQFAASLRDHPKVRLLEGTNVRELDRRRIGGQVDVVVADLSFISLRLVLAALRVCGSEQADYVLLVKPQFEVGKSAVGSSGVVRSPALRLRAVSEVLDEARAHGLGVAGLVRSDLRGAHGNVEYLAWLRAGEDAVTEEAVRDVVTGAA